MTLTWRGGWKGGRSEPCLLRFYWSRTLLLVLVFTTPSYCFCFNSFTIFSIFFSPSLYVLHSVKMMPSRGDTSPIVIGDSVFTSTIHTTYLNPVLITQHNDPRLGNRYLILLTTEQGLYTCNLDVSGVGWTLDNSTGVTTADTRQFIPISPWVHPFSVDMWIVISSASLFINSIHIYFHQFGHKCN